MRHVYGAVLGAAARSGHQKNGHKDEKRQTGQGTTTRREVHRESIDAFGNLINSTFTSIPPGATAPAATANEFLFAGEQYDADLHLYYNRARYLNVSTGRFWSMDTDEGNDQAPLSLHKYPYGQANPIGNIDPEGTDTIDAVDSSESYLAFAVLRTIRGADALGHLFITSYDE